ncbi:hypothetical protein H9Q69_010232 [Fusarium xylarioides]|nr:hypothetical protein H9Q69_010232 [Fusarium xylarioides]
MSSHNWIEVQFGEKQELSPILVEHRPAYSVFDCQAFLPRIVLSIGGEQKRHFYRSIDLDDRVDQGAGVVLRPVQLATLILDCELHNQTRLDRVQGHCASSSANIPVFPPRLTFGKNYSAALCRAEASLNEESLSDRVCQVFTWLALERKDGSSVRAHLRLLSDYKVAWRDCTEEDLCFVCLVRPTSTTLDCKHRLCDACVVICGI